MTSLQCCIFGPMRYGKFWCIFDLLSSFLTSLTILGLTNCQSTWPSLAHCQTALVILWQKRCATSCGDSCGYSGPKPFCLAFVWYSRVCKYVRLASTFLVRASALVLQGYSLLMTLHVYTLHTSTYHSIPLHTITYHCIPWHTITYHYIPLHTITYNYIPVHTFTCHYMPLHTITYHYIPLHAIIYHFMALHTITYHYIPLHAFTIPLHYITLHDTTLHYTTLHCTTQDTTFHSKLLRTSLHTLEWCAFYYLAFNCIHELSHISAVEILDALRMMSTSCLYHSWSRGPNLRHRRSSWLVLVWTRWARFGREPEKLHPEMKDTHCTNEWDLWCWCDGRPDRKRRRNTWHIDA